MTGPQEQEQIALRGVCVHKLTHRKAQALGGGGGGGGGFRAPQLRDIDRALPGESGVALNIRSS